MFFAWNGTSIRVNCLVTPDSDVSGIGVRGALYIQTAIMILLTCFKLQPDDVFFSNLSIQITSAALIGAAYFDPTIDVPHTLVASQFSVLFSACRITYYDLPMLFLRYKAATKIVSQIWVLDILFRTGLTIFNYRVWSTIISLQNQPSVCEGGFGQWTILSSPIDLSVRHPVTTFAFAYCILDIMWEVFRFVAHITKTWAVETISTVPSDDALDPRFWCLQKAVFYGLRKCGFIYTQEAIYVTRLSKLMLVISFLRKWIVFIFVSIAIENTVVMNGLETAESHWTFGQIFAMVNTFSLVCILLNQGKSTMLSSRMLSTMNRRLHYWGIGKDEIEGFLVGLCVTMPLMFYLDWKYMGEWAEKSGWPPWIAYPLIAFILFVLAVYVAPLLVVSALVVALGWAIEIGWWPNSTASVIFAAIGEACSFVFRPFGYALGILEVQTLEEETALI
jgi:hypothetical protein